MSDELRLPLHLIPMYNEVFKRLVREALLAYFNQDIRDNYYIHDWAQLSGGDWVIELKRRQREEIRAAALERSEPPSKSRKGWAAGRKRK